MRPFNLDLAKRGASVVTREGKPVRIICFDRKDEKRKGNIIALVSGSDKYEQIVQYHESGQQINFISDLDLMME